MIPSTVAEVASLLPDRVLRHYGSDERVESLRAALGRFADDARPVTPAALAEVEDAARSVFRHIELRPDQGLVPEEHSAGWPPDDLAAVRRAGAGLGSVQRLPDGTARISLDELAPVAAAAPLLLGAFAAVGGAARLVLDLRRNGGGDPATAVLVVDWLAGHPPRHLFDVRYADRTREWWTAGACPVPPPGCPVRVLIGAETFSSGEALAWTLQNQGLARLAGTPTPGGADHVVPLALTHDVRALIPEAAVRAPGGGPTWEGAGVCPDEPIGPDDGP